MSRARTSARLIVVVPVLPMAGRNGGPPGMSVRLHGRPLFVHAARTAVEVAAAGVVVSAPRGGGPAVQAMLTADRLHRIPVVEGGDTLGEVLTTLVISGSVPRGRAGAVLVHDPRCPLVPASYLQDVMASSRADSGAVLVATRPMTDTVKSVADGVVLATVDRDLLRVLSSPLVLPAGLLHDLAGRGSLDRCADVEDLIELARTAGAQVRWTLAPATGRRVSGASAASVLECLTEVRAERPGSRRG